FGDPEQAVLAVQPPNGLVGLPDRALAAQFKHGGYGFPAPRSGNRSSRAKPDGAVRRPPGKAGAHGLPRPRNGGLLTRVRNRAELDPKGAGLAQKRLFQRP